MRSRGRVLRRGWGAVPVALVPVALVLALLALLAGFPAPPAASHGALLTSDPADSSTLEALPSRAVLTFTDVVTEVREIAVTGPDGSVTNGAPTSSDAEVRQNLWAGPDGAYELEYHVVSGDGHEVRGAVHFEVGSGAVVEDSAADDAERPGGAAEPSRGAGEVRPGVVLGATAALLLAGVALGVVRRRRHRRT